ncbi:MULTISPECIES: hypothetical protein [unclassified Streptomyces]|uniref:hypothetical protein n=1 Tax=unclassified Streptomyces TaxID=2593676 RepID=UPI00380465DF
MIERAHRKRTSRLPEFADTSIPLYALAQTAVVSIFAITVRWISVLLTAIAATLAWRGLELPAELFLAVPPMAWLDRSGITYLRIRRM